MDKKKIDNKTIEEVSGGVWAAINGPGNEEPESKDNFKNYDNLEDQFQKD